MKMAVVAGGWHWPGHFFWEMYGTWRGCDFPVDLFVVAHRSPELEIVRSEKKERLESSTGPLADLDRKLYCFYPTIQALQNMGWHYQEAPNTIGDWGFFNQWLETHDYREYDVILNCHDDTFIRSREMLSIVAESWEKEKWLILGNGKYPEAPVGYVRGSFEFWSREMLDMLGGKINLGQVTLTREGRTDSPEGMEALSPWNYMGVPLRKFIEKQGLSDRIKMLSPYYRISTLVIEGERGFINQQEGAPWSFQAGLKELAPKLLDTGITVYTVILNDYDELKPPLVVEPGVKYVCFSDYDYNCPPWEIRKLPLLPLLLPEQRNSRIPKILSHRYIDSEYSIYHDGSCVLSTEPSRLIREFLGDHDLAVYRHPIRTSIQEERDACVKLKVYTGLGIDNQVTKYRDWGLGPGLWCGGVVIRRNTERVRDFNNIWWREYLSGCVRDQISLPWAIHESGVSVNTIRENITEDKKRFRFHYHKKDKRR